MMLALALALAHLPHVQNSYASHHVLPGALWLFLLLLFLVLALARLPLPQYSYAFSHVSLFLSERLLQHMLCSCLLNILKAHYLRRPYHYWPSRSASFGFIVHFHQVLILIPKRASSAKGHLGGVSELLYLLLQAVYTRSIERISILLKLYYIATKAPLLTLVL